MGVPGEFESVLYPISVGLMALLVGLVPLWQLLRGEVVLWGMLWLLGPLAYVGYFLLASVHRVFVSADGMVTFRRGWGDRSVSVWEIQRIRPWFHVSRVHFVVELARGSELLIGDPKTVAYLVRDLRLYRTDLLTIGVSSVDSLARSGRSTRN